MPRKKKNSLSAKQMKELRSAFEMFDKNGDGSIEKDEIKAVLQSMGVCPSQSDLQDMMKHSDLDGNGSIQFEEFVELMKSRMGSLMKTTTDLAEDELIQIFKMFDLDGSGYISPFELKEVMGKLGENITDQELKIMVTKADKDGDGLINFKEFEYIMNHM